MPKNVFKKLELKDLVLLGLFVALAIVLKKMTIGSSILQIGFGFIGTVLLAYKFGPFWGSIGAMIVDIVGTLIFNSGGVFFPGFTISAIVAAIIYGIFLYEKPIAIWRIAVSTILVTIIVNIFMNTYWIAWMANFKINFNILLVQRLAKELISPWIQMIIIYVILKAINNVKIKQ